MPAVTHRPRALPLVTMALALCLPMQACLQNEGTTSRDVKKMNTRQGQTVNLGVSAISYLERPIFEIKLNGVEVGVGGGSLMTGVPIKLGPQVISWRLGGPKGMPGNGDTVKAVNIPELKAVDAQFRYLGVHIYPDNTVEVIPERFWPERTEKGEDILRSRSNANGQ